MKAWCPTHPKRKTCFHGAPHALGELEISPLLVVQQTVLPPFTFFSRRGSSSLIMDGTWSATCTALFGTPLCKSRDCINLTLFVHAVSFRPDSQRPLLSQLELFSTGAFRVTGTVAREHERLVYTRETPSPKPIFRTNYYNGRDLYYFNPALIVQGAQLNFFLYTTFVFTAV